MSAGTMGTKYAVKLKTDFDNPKWINRHRFMFNFLDKNGDGQITLDEIVAKASDDICAKLNALQNKPNAIKIALKLFLDKLAWNMAKKSLSQNILKDGRNWQPTT